MTIDKLVNAVNFADWNLWVCAATVVFCPLWWNVIGRIEYRTRCFSRLFGSPYLGITALAVSILANGLYRDWRFFLFMDSQRRWSLSSSEELACRLLGHSLWFVGVTLILSSTYKLGLCNTFLGDYFGVLLDKKVETFPFNILNHPMYVGASLNFVGSAISQMSTAGLLMCVLVILVYVVAAAAEGAFTEQIYSLVEQYKRGELSRSHPRFKAVEEAIRRSKGHGKNN